MMKATLFLCLLLCLFGCSSKRSSGYSIGYEPTWFPLDTGGLEKNILAFSIELLQEVAKQEKLALSIRQMNWDTLLWGLREKKYDAVLSSMQPYTFYQRQYSFSSPYLLTGPAIVTRVESKMDSLNSLKNKEVAVVRGSQGALLLEKVDGVLIRYYQTIPEALNDLESVIVDAAVIDILEAQNFVRDLYAGRLKLSSLPLDSQGLRLISLFKKDPALMKAFDHGLEKLKKKGTYEQLLQKWGLSEDSSISHEIMQEQIDRFLHHLTVA